MFGDSGAVFSPDRIYRYALFRNWREGEGRLAVIGLNPSTADEVENDPTVTRCIKRAKFLGLSGLIMLNIFAYRSTDPKNLKLTNDPVGPDNNDSLVKYSSDATLVLCAWGNHGQLMNRSRQVVELLKKNNISLYVLKLNEKSGEPVHPLYQPYELSPTPWESLINR